MLGVLIGGVAEMAVIAKKINSTGYLSVKPLR
jgi:hypothetical protein